MTKIFRFHRSLIASGLFAGVGLLTGCASITSGTHEVIQITTSPTTNADCLLENTRGQWEVKTPGTAKVHRDDKPLDIHCHKLGYHEGSTRVYPKTNGAIYGNILAGGIIGIVVDGHNKSGYKYPSLIKVPMYAITAKKHAHKKLVHVALSK